MGPGAPAVAEVQKRSDVPAGRACQKPQPLLCLLPLTHRQHRPGQSFSFLPFSRYPYQSYSLVLNCNLVACLVIVSIPQVQAAQRAQPSLNAFRPSSTASAPSQQANAGSALQSWSGVSRPDVSISSTPSLAAQGSGVFAQQAGTSHVQPPSNQQTAAHVLPPLRQVQPVTP